MATEPRHGEDESWVGPLLSRHTDRRELDVDAFVTRVLTRADAVRAPADGPSRSRPVRRRLLPVLVAAASVVTVGLAATGVSAVVRWTGRDDRAVVVRTSTSPAPSLQPEAGTPSPSVPPSPGPSTTSSGPAGVTLPSSFRWRTGAPVLSPRVQAGRVIGLKDPTVVYSGGRWHVFVTTVGDAGFGLAYLSFASWSEANTAPLHPLAASPIGAGFRAAPQVFWFAPQKLWYLVYQTGSASYSTNPDIADPQGWSAPKNFYPTVPELIRKNLTGGFWVSMWVICDRTDCYLFSSDNHGHLFRSRTPKASFPNGMSAPVVAAQDAGQGTLFAADRVYRVTGTGRYLLLAQAFGPDGHGYLGSWTSTRLDGGWTPLADTPDTPFAGTGNLTFTGQPWAGGIVHGELIRDGDDESLSVSPCHLRLLALGLDPQVHDDRTFRIGLLTQTTPTCG